MVPATHSGAGDASRRAARRWKLFRERMPEDGLFAGHTWRFAPEPFVLLPEQARGLEELGRILLRFLRVCDRLYRKSVEGTMPGWVAELLDRGKPESLVRLQRDPAFRGKVPRVIRPDMLLTGEGFAITELDSVPGGIGLTGWFNRIYAELADRDGSGFPLGGASGPVEGFRGIFGDAPRIHVVVSEEAGVYRPEMRWMAEEISREVPCAVRGGDDFDPDDGDAVYRFFELFDLDNVPGADALLEAARQRRILLTPPPCSLYEEKMLFGLFWNRNLQDFWRQELGGGFLRRLQSCIPYTWILDPEPLPPHAAYPGLELTDWRQLGTLSQRNRNLILKISGYSPQAWGARGVFLGSDMPGRQWSGAVDQALARFEENPHVLQRFVRPGTRTVKWYDPDADRLVEMKGRTRLCPYYFVHGKGDEARVVLGGCLATTCPADKHIIHGMSRAVMSPCTVAEEECIRIAPGRE